MRRGSIVVLFLAACGRAEDPVPPPPAKPPAAMEESPPPAPAPEVPEVEAPAMPKKPTIGLTGPIGPVGEPKRVKRLIIEKPGVYENYLVDAEWAGRNTVKIVADNVTLRNCEIRNATHNGVGVFADDVLIENCRIHHLLKGTFEKQQDAHGITGRPHRLTIRNCEIYYVSGDALQFCPDREPWNDVLVENCVFWTGPLPEDAAGFRKGERPGENALDTKQENQHPRSRMIFRNSVCYGWKQPGQIEMMAALNIKNKVDVRVENCVFFDNEVCLRLRGPGGYEGSWVTVENCLFYDSGYAVRAEDSIEKMKLLNSGYGHGVGRRYRAVSGKPKDARIEGDHDAPPLTSVYSRE